MFAERISFVETRDYVRIIQRNEEIYRALYGPEVVQHKDVAAPAAVAEDGDTEQQQM